MCYIFSVFSFCCIIWKINYNANIPSKTFRRPRKLLTHFYARSFLSIRLLNELSYSFHLIYNLSPFLLSTFSILNSFWYVFLQFFSFKASSNWLTIQVTNHSCPRNCIFNVANNKNFFWPNWSISFSKNVFLFWYSDMITNFKFRILGSVNCVIVFFNNIL